MSRLQSFKSLVVPQGHIVRNVELFFKSAPTTAVAITGEFCSREFRCLPMQMADDGGWRLRLMLTPGRYRYQFIVNGHWLNDPQTCSANPGDFGTANCVLGVE